MTSDFNEMMCAIDDDIARTEPAHGSPLPFIVLCLLFDIALVFALIHIL